MVLCGVIWCGRLFALAHRVFPMPVQELRNVVLMLMRRVGKLQISPISLYCFLVPLDFTKVLHCIALHCTRGPLLLLQWSTSCCVSFVLLHCI